MNSFTFDGQQINVPNGIPSGGLSYLQKILNNFVTVFILAGVVLLVIYIIWAGLLWITSGGDKQKLTAARGRLTWAIVGFIILLLAFFIINAIGYFFKVNLLKLG